MVERPEPRQQKLTPACNAHWRCHADVRAAQEQFCIGAPEALRAQASTRADVKEALRHRKNKSDEKSVLLQSINLTGFSQSRFSSIGGRSTGGDASSGRPAVWGSPSCVPGVHPHPRHLNSDQNGAEPPWTAAGQHPTHQTEARGGGCSAGAACQQRLHTVLPQRACELVRCGVRAGHADETRRRAARRAQPRHAPRHIGCAAASPPGTRSGAGLCGLQRPLIYI